MCFFFSCKCSFAIGRKEPEKCDIWTAFIALSFFECSSDENLWAFSICIESDSRRKTRRKSTNRPNTPPWIYRHEWPHNSHTQGQQEAIQSYAQTHRANALLNDKEWLNDSQSKAMKRQNEEWKARMEGKVR